jgi:hypothetical protein
VYVEPEGAAVRSTGVAAPAGGVHVTFTGLPPTTLFAATITATPGQAVREVETDIVGKLTSIVRLGVPVILVLGHVKLALPFMKVQLLIIWPVLSVTA